MSRPKINRRQALKTIGLTAGAVGAAASGFPLPSLAQPMAMGDRRFLIVLAATGGASIIDAMMAVRESESGNAAIMNVYPDAMVQDIDGTPFRAIDQQLDDLGPLPYSGSAVQSDFVRRHAQDMMVVTRPAKNFSKNIFTILPKAKSHLFI